MAFMVGPPTGSAPINRTPPKQKVESGRHGKRGEIYVMNDRGKPRRVK